MSNKPKPIVYISRRVQFAAAHRLYRKDLTPQKNRELYGPCVNEHGHGHNYVLEVTLKGPIDPATDMVMNLTELKKILEQEVMSTMDHRHLSVDVPVLKGINPTAENLVIVIWRLLVGKLPTGMLHEVKLRETENNVSIYRGESG
jgi:6-pyruvoyltetrahydropterin/6-carboxytetrahydropterin synthase